MTRDAGLEDAEELTRIITSAFSNDPIMNWAFGSNQPIQTVFREMINGCYLKNGFAHIIDGAAATLWLSSGEIPKLPFPGEMRIAFDVLRAGGFNAVRRGLAFNSAVERSHPRSDHYYLFAVGVLPSKQGQGLGRQIISDGLALADKERAPVYLENSRAENLPLYRSLGFRERGNIKLPIGAPPLIPMWREKAA